MLGVLSNNALDSVNKDLGLIQALAKEGLKFLLGNRNVNLILHIPLILLPAKQEGIFEESGGK